MATGTNGIATRENINSLKAGTYDSDLKRCVTFDSLTDAGFSISKTNIHKYLSNLNRLVRYSDIDQQVVLTFKFVIDISSDSNMYNNGPITLEADRSIILGYSASDAAPSFEYVREVEATETDPDTSVSPILDNETQVIESSDTLTPAAVTSFGASVGGGSLGGDRKITLTKNDSSVNLLEATTYGPSEVAINIENGKKQVTYTLLTETYSISNITPATYKLSYGGASYLKNSNNKFSKGQIYASSTSEDQYEIITVNTNSSAVYTFLGYLKLPGVTPPTPTTTYKFRLRFRFDTVPSYQIKVNFICTIYSSSGTVLKNCSVSDRTFTVSEMPFDIISINGNSYNYYYIDLWTGDTAPQYVTISSRVFKYNSSSGGNNWTAARNTIIENTRYTGTSPSLSGSGAAYTTLNPYNNYYSVDCLVNISR